MTTQQYTTAADDTTLLCLTNREVTAILDHHGVTSATADRVAAMCLECGTITVATDREQRDTVQWNFDLTCHNPHTTILPRF